MKTSKDLIIVTETSEVLHRNVKDKNLLTNGAFFSNDISINSKITLEYKNMKNKVRIHNKVLENPWKPILPNYRIIQHITVNEVSQFNCDTKSMIKKDDIVLKTKEVVENSSVTSDKSKEVICSTCKQGFFCKELLEIHMRGHKSIRRYTCTDCGKTFSQLRNFKYHMSVHRGTKDYAATCPVCGKHFNDRGYLGNHLKIHRNRKEYKCSQCPKSFNQRVAYNMHVRTHTGVKPHVCSECGKAFSRKMLLNQHTRTHSGERPYACPDCGKKFADRSNMTLHRRLHTGAKPFKCSLCSKSFTKKHHLQSHLNFHAGVKPYSCPRCRLAFTQSSNMRTHYKKCNAPHSRGEQYKIN